MKIFVTGDNHIGLKYGGHSESARKALVAERINAVTRMVRKANAEECGLFAVTGDFFDDEKGIAQKYIKVVADALGDFRGTVAVLPGNHDFYSEEADVWKKFKEYAADNTVLLCEYRPYTLEIGDDEAVIYPAYCDMETDKGKNRLDWIKNTEIIDDGKFRIGMAHGAVDGKTIDTENEYFKMTYDELRSIPVDVWLIGHTHVPFPNDLTEEFTAVGERIFNAGSHVQPDINTNTEGQCFILEIDAQKNIKAKKYISGGLCFCRAEVTVTAGNMERGLVEKLSSFGDSSVIYLTVKGAVCEEEYTCRNAIVDRSTARFLEVKDINLVGLTMLIDDSVVKKEFSETSTSARLLNALCDPIEKQLAYDLIKEIKKEGR